MSGDGCYKKIGLGFSMIELAIILSVLSILTVIISGGAALVNQAKMQGIIYNATEYKLGYHAFIATYEELPGDMRDESALSWFGITNHERGRYSTAGDGYIGGKSEGPMAFWHMQLAGLIEGDYNGLYDLDEIPGEMVGSTKYHGETGFNFVTFGIGNNKWGYDALEVYGLKKIEMLVFGTVYLAHNHIVSNAAISASNAHEIDRKMDNGLPYSGSVLADHGEDVGSDNKCINNSKFANEYVSTDAPLAYIINEADLSCRMMFKL